MTELILNMRPYSKKNSRKARRWGKMIFTVPSDNYESFAQIAKWELKDQASHTTGLTKYFDVPVEVSTIFFVKGQANFDSDNMHTGILDILQEAGIIKNDKKVYGGWHEKVMGRKDWFIQIIIKDYTPSVYAKGEYGK